MNKFIGRKAYIMAKVIFECPAEVKSGTPLMEVLDKAPFKIKVPCGKGKCGKCKCRVTGEVNAPTENEKKRLSEKELAAGCRLACEVIVEGEVHVMKAEKKDKK